MSSVSKEYTVEYYLDIEASAANVSNDNVYILEEI